jgi:hypothetical protein
MRAAAKARYEIYAENYKRSEELGNWKLGREEETQRNGQTRSMTVLQISEDALAVSTW